jgi:hypothetical protein
MAFGNHLCAHQNVDGPRMYLCELTLKLAFEARTVGVNTGNAQRSAIGATYIGQQFTQVFFQLLGATA